MNFTGVKAPEPPKSVKEYRPVTDYMTKNVITFHPDQSIAEAMDVFLREGISGAPVVDDSGKICGILSEIDCLKIMVDEAYHNLPHGRISVSQYMSNKISSVIITALCIILNYNSLKFTIHFTIVFVLIYMSMARLNLLFGLIYLTFLFSQGLLIYMVRRILRDQFSTQKALK